MTDAGRQSTVHFPRSVRDLRDRAICPACFTPLTATVCAVCGLDVAHAAAAELAAVSDDAAGLLERRASIIGRIRADTASAPAPPAAVIPRAEIEPERSDTVPTPVIVEPRGPRRSSVQVVLLVVGISLLSIAAIFFLVYAFITFGIVWRSVIIGAITVATIVSASMLRRRRLPGTAEGIAAFGVVLVYLDAFAIRANDLVGAASADGTTYWGAVLLLSTAGFMVWSRTTGMRTPSIASALALSPGAALLVYGVAEIDDTSTRIVLAALAAALVGVLHRLTPHRFERTASLLLGGIGLVVAQIAALSARPDAVPPIAVAGVALVAALLAASAGPAPRLARSILAGATGFALATEGIAVCALIGGSGAVLVSVPASVAALVTLVADVGWHRSSRRPWGAAAIGAAAAASITGAATVIAAATTAVRAAAAGLAGWERAPLGNVADWAWAALITTAACGALFVLETAVARRLHQRRPAIIIAIGLTLVLAGAYVPTLSGILLAWFVIAAVGAALLIRLRVSEAPLRVAIAIVTGAALALGYPTGWADDITLPVTAVATIAILVTLRWSVRPTAARVALLLAAQLVGHVGAGQLARILSPEASGASLQFVAVLATAIALFAAVAPRLPVAERRALLWPSLVVAVVVGGSWTVVGRASLVDAAVWLALAATSIIATIRTSLAPEERAILPGLLGPALALSLGTAAGAAHAAIPLWWSAIGAAVAVSFCALALSIRGVRTIRRGSLDIGAALVLLAAAAIVPFDTGATGWLAPLVGGIAVLATALSRDGLVGSSSWRRHLGWVALGLGVASLWWRLAEVHSSAVEAYTLPVAGALLAVWGASAALDRRRGTDVSSPLLLAGLVAALVPLGIAGASGTLARPVIVAVSSAGIMLAASVATRSSRTLDTLAVGGALGLTTVAIARALATDTTTSAFDAWIGALVVPLAAASLLQSRRDENRTRVLVAHGIGVAALATTALTETWVLQDDMLGLARALFVLLLLCGIHVIARIVRHPILDGPIAWTALTGAALIAVRGVIIGVLDPLELATVPLAVALLAVGIQRLERDGRARSWPHLGPGLLVMLGPSLAVTIVDRPVWRLVALGVVAVATLAIGAVRRMQAPVVIGAVVALWHGVATFAPQIRLVYESVYWWIWAGLGGVLLIVLAARYERRIRDLRAVGERIASLR